MKNIKSGRKLSKRTAFTGNILKKLAIGLMVLMLLGSILSSCSSAKADPVDKCRVHEGCELTEAQLNTLATYIRDTSNSKVSDYSLREIFTAAYLGNDMTAKDYDDSKFVVTEPAETTTADTAATETDAVETDAVSETTSSEQETSAEDTAAVAAGETTAASGSDTDTATKTASEEYTVPATINLNLAKTAIKMFDPSSDIAALAEKMTVADVASVIAGLRVSYDINNPNRSFLGSILYYIGVALMWITNTVGFGSYIIGLLWFSIIIELLMIPFTIKQQKNSIKQAKLRPKEMAIRKKYAGRDDNVTKQKVSEEIQALYQSENFNQLGGCLPLLLQMPIIFALYYIVIDPLQYMLGWSTNLSTVFSTYFTTARAAGGFGESVGSNRGTIEILSQIKDAGNGAFESLKDFTFFSSDTCVDSYNAIDSIKSSIPDFSIGNVNFGLTPNITNFNWLLLVPILTFVVYFISMKLSRKMSYQPTTADDPGMGCSNKMMDFTMPIMSVFISFAVPAVVGVYWMFKSIIGTFKTFLMNKIMPLPKFTEEDYKAAEREYAGKVPKKRAPSEGGRSSGAPRRSLHYIDEDEYGSEPVAPRKKNEPYREDDDTDAKDVKEKDHKLLDDVSLKDDDRNEKSEKSKKNKKDKDNGNNNDNNDSGDALESDK